MKIVDAPSFDDEAVMDFFLTSGRNLLAAEIAACVGHHVALSLAGTDRVEGSGCLRARAAQEHLVKASRIPYTIVRSTRCFHSDRVVAVLADVAVSRPLNGSIGIDAPEGVGKVA